MHHIKGRGQVLSPNPFGPLASQGLADGRVPMRGAVASSPTQLVADRVGVVSRERGAGQPKHAWLPDFGAGRVSTQPNNLNLGLDRPKKDEK